MFCDAGVNPRLEVVTLCARRLTCSTEYVSETVLAEVKRSRSGRNLCMGELSFVAREVLVGAAVTEMLLCAGYLVCSAQCIAGTLLAEVSLRVTAFVAREMLEDLWYQKSAICWISR
jgi:hypothetical protein